MKKPETRKKVSGFSFCGEKLFLIGKKFPEKGEERKQEVKMKNGFFAKNA